MKVRFSQDKIRIRLQEEELVILEKEETVEISTFFSPIDRMFIRLSTWIPTAIGYALENNCLHVFIPATSLETLRAGETFSAAFDEGQALHAQLIVEVDLPCKH